MNSQTPNEPGSPPKDPDDLLEEVGRVARKDEMADSDHLERLKKLAADELSQDELAALRVEAETSDELARDLEAFSPLGEEFRERVLRRLRDEADVVDMDRDRPRRPLTRRQPRRRGLRRAWPALAAAAVVVAVLGAWLYRQVATPFQYPGYSMDLAGAIQDVRGEEKPSEGLPEFGPGSILRLTMTPDVEPVSRPQFTFYFAGADGELFEWDRFSQDGAAVRLEAKLGEDLDLTPGVWTVHFVYGEPGELPSPRSAGDLDRGSKTWKVVSQRFRVVAGSAAAELPLEVLWAGCYASWIDEGQEPVCVPNRQVSIWASSTPGAEFEIRLAGRPVDDETGGDGESIDGGRRWVVSTTPDDDTLEVIARRGGLETSYHLTLSSNLEPEWLKDAIRAEIRGDLSAARVLLESHLESAEPWNRGLALAVLSRVADHSVARQEARDEAVRLLFETRQTLRWIQYQEQRWVELWELGHIDQIRQDVDAAPEPRSSLPAEARILVQLYRGKVRSAVGDLRSALPALRAASDMARRTGEMRYLGATEARLAEALQLVGQSERAERVLQEFIVSSSFETLYPCLQAEILTMHGWNRMLAGDDHDAIASRFTEAETRLGGQTCDAELPLNLGLNRAMLEERDGEAFQSRRILASLEPQLRQAGSLYRLWWYDLEGRLSLREGTPGRALDSFQRMEQLAEDTFELRASWRARIQQARALETLGQVEDALDAYSAAEALLDRRSLAVPLDAGRERFLADRSIGTRRHLELLLRQGQEWEAFAAARRSRSRVLRSLRQGHRLASLDPQAKLRWDTSVSGYLDLRRRIESDVAETWRLNSAEREEQRARLAKTRRQALQHLDRAFLALGPEDPSLPPLRADELVLAYHPLEDGWVGFAARPGEIGTTRFQLREAVITDAIKDADPFLPVDLVDQLVAPFERQVAEAQRLRILPFGVLEQVDFHALPWGDDVLLAAKPVVYGLDLDPVPEPVHRAGRGKALVVGNPRSDLPAAEREARSAATALADSYVVTHLFGPEATVDAVRTELRGLDLFHLAGHGNFGDSSPWESSLPMAGETQLTLGDVLAMDDAPSQVILSSCESARGGPGSQAGLGLAQAFLVAGTQEVIASVRPIDDGSTETLFRRLHGTKWGAGDLAERMRNAQLAWRAHDSPADWASFRILVP